MAKLNEKSKVIFLLGPTGCGKSDFAVQLAKRLNGEIISSDSVQIYKEFNIGSAKVTESEMGGIIHHGIDILSPDQEFSAQQFTDYTKAKIEEISARGHLPIVVGGTGLYIKSLVEGYNFAGVEKHQDFRDKLEQEAQNFGLDSLYIKLEKLDKALAEKTDRFNKARVIRALEIATFGGSKTKNNKLPYDFKLYALNMDRDKLYDRINRRVDIMIKAGLIDEVRSLVDKYGKTCQPMRAIGYKEVISYLEGEISEKDMVELIQQHSRNYAKRQLTFLRGMNGVEYIDALDKENELMRVIKEIELWLKQPMK